MLSIKIQKLLWISSFALAGFYGCDDEEDPSPSGGAEMAGDTMAGDTMAGDTMAGDTMAGDTMAGDTMAGDTMAGDTMAGMEEGPTCSSCDSDDDCERGQSCIAMDNSEMIRFCFAPCFDDGACAEDGFQCSTLSHEQNLYICVPPTGCEFCYDLDGDGYGMGPSCEAIDCNDEEADINRGMLDDVCDGIDNDCNGLVDDDFPGICPAPNWRVVNETDLVDRWAIYEMIFYSDAQCSNPLQNLIEAPFSSVVDEELESYLHDGLINPIEALPWIGGILEEALANASFAGYSYNNPKEVNCVDLYQSTDDTQRQDSLRLQSGFSGEWSSNILMIGVDQEDQNGLAFTRFIPSICGDGLLAPNEACDSDALYCIACEITYAGEGEPCVMAEQEVALCEEGFACITMEGEGSCQAPRILIEEEECDPNDPTAICEAGLTCFEGNNGYICSQE